MSPLHLDVSPRRNRRFEITTLSLNVSVNYKVMGATFQKKGDLSIPLRRFKKLHKVVGVRFSVALYFRL